MMETLENLNLNLSLSFSLLVVMGSDFTTRANKTHLAENKENTKVETKRQTIIMDNV